MKKVLILTLLAVSFAGSAFAAAMVTGTPCGAGLTITGGVSQTAADGASNPLVRLSTGVEGQVNFQTTGTAPTLVSTSYAIITKHTSGSKYFGTANDSTNIYWKQAVKGSIVTTESGTTDSNANFTSAAGWTAY